MKILKILGAVGKGVIKDFIPGYETAKEVIGAINAVLPGNKQLSENATGEEAMKAISELPAEQQAELLSKKFDVEISAIKGHTDVITVLAQADMAGSSTRPYIAKCMCFVVCYTVIALNSAIFYAIVAGKHEVLKAIGEAWPLILAILGTPTALLKAYFGMRTEEKKTRANAALGVPVHMPTAGMISSVIKKIF